MFENNFLLQLAVALALGMLVGFQREWAEQKVAGIRTFPLITVLGAVAARLAAEYGGWVLGAGLLAVAAMLFMGNYAAAKKGKARSGATTEIAALVMFAVGALLVAGSAAAAVATAGATAVLLQWKRPLHEFVARVGEDELRAISKLVLIGLVIWPLLPDQGYGPYEVLNPFEMWGLVVLIVGISLAAWICQRALGPRVGTLLAGILGGLISSTATSVGYARRAHAQPQTAPTAAAVIVIASAVVFARVLVEVWIVAPASLVAIAPPLLAMTAWMAMLSALALVLLRGEAGRPPAGEAPTNFRAAVVFGLLYAGVLLAVAYAKEQFAEEGLYAVAGLSGLTDMDAITLSTAQLVRRGQLEPDTGWRLILVGALANLVFKFGVVAVLGTRRLLARVGLLFLAATAGGVALLLFWPVSVS